VVFWWAFLREEAPYVPPEIVLPPSRDIKINFEALEKAKEFWLYTEIQPFKGVTPTDGEGGLVEIKIGRENPFIPY